MQFRRSMMSSVMVLLLAGVAVTAIGTAQADLVKGRLIRGPGAIRPEASLAKLRMNDVGDPDTVFIGHVTGATGLPGVASGFGINHVGRGGSLVTDALNQGGAANNGYWNFDDLNPGETDTHQGWWILGEPQQSISSNNSGDYWKPFFCFDFGNNGNLKGNGLKPTFGVVGYWHVDGGASQAPVANGLPQNGPAPSVGPTFTPVGGGAAWCGLRAHGDFAYTDPVTGGVFNSSIVQYYGDNSHIQTGSGTGNHTAGGWPGYGNQWDQMLYRDVAVSPGGSLTLSFDYETAMSTSAQSNATNLETGWFNLDPRLDVSATANFAGHTEDGNFISATGVPVGSEMRDSFMVYVGVPVDDGAVTYSDGVTLPVGDPLRRWFSEVLAIDGWTPGPTNGIPGDGIGGDEWPSTLIQVLSVAGTGTGSPSITIPSGKLAPILAASGGNVRVVFRVKTNRGWSDEDATLKGFSSGGKGAAIVDNVVINGLTTNFNATSDINNALPATSAWRSTGKPVGEDYFVFRNVGGPGQTQTIEYYDPCGAIGGAGRNCDMIGNVMAATHSAYLTNSQDRQRTLVSPTINMSSTGNGDYNGMGIDAEIADASSITLLADVYFNGILGLENGEACRIGWQTFPAIQGNGVTTWGVMKKSAFFTSIGVPGCGVAGWSGFDGIEDGLIASALGVGKADSIRAYIELCSVCFRRNVDVTTCHSLGLGPDKRGAYYDNISISFIDAAAPPGLSLAPWDILQDAFPTNETLETGDEAFIRGTVRVTGGHNVSSGPVATVPGDTMWVRASGSPVRVDLVFRIKPGPGNYETIGQPGSGLRKNPAVAGSASPGDGSFWGSYMADRGIYGTGYVSPAATPVPNPMTDGVSGGGLDWNPDEWLSARMDTLEFNLFYCDGSAPSLPVLQPDFFASMYHESELGLGAPRATLGAIKERCILINTALGSSQSMDNIDCGSGTTPASGVSWADRWNTATTPNYVSNLIGGYVDNTCGGPCANGYTGEFTKIIPDDLLTPGAHIEFFFRRTYEGNFADAELLPDSTRIYPNYNNDGARWFGFNALPDLWKDPAYNNFGYTASVGLPCMLFVDIGDGRAEHLVWDTMAHVVGLTASWKRGANSGYYLPATAPLPAPANLAGLTAVGGTAVSQHIGQDGSLYDVFNVRGGESNVPAGRLGSRYNVGGVPCAGLLAGKCSTAGPEKRWLRELYQHVYFNDADLGAGSIGPYSLGHDDDIGMLTEFINNGTGTPSPRTLIVTGVDAVYGQVSQNPAQAHPTFFPQFFDATLVNPDYRKVSSSFDDTPDLIPQAAITGGSGEIYSVWSSCFTPNDVLGLGGTLGGSVAAFYEDTNPGDGTTYRAGIYAPENVGANRFARTLVMGFTPGWFGGLGSRYTLNRHGYHLFWLNALTTMIGTVCDQTLSAPVGVGDGGSPGSAFVNFMNLRSPNPSHSGTAVIEFGLVKSEKVQVNVYDVTGRMVKTLADREFKAGDIHRLTWDGTDVGGRSVARGVYFYQLRSPSFTSQKKLTVLRD